MEYINYIEHVKQSFVNSDYDISQINEEILHIEGMTGLKTRHLYNNILDMKDARYLEIGTWKGSSVCSAMIGNNATVVCIDNWSEFGGPKDEFQQNFNKFKGENNAIFIEHDCFTLDTSSLGKFNVYMYDGGHKEDEHFRALNHYINNMDDIFIFIVDDWNWEEVRTGTQNSLKNLNLNILYEYEIRTTNDNTHPPFELGAKTWWNGIYVAVLQKS